MSGGYVLKKQGEDPLLYFNLLYILVGLYRHIFTYNKWPLRITIKSFALGDCNALIEYAIAEVELATTVPCMTSCLYKPSLRGPEEPNTCFRCSFMYISATIEL